LAVVGVFALGVGVVHEPDQPRAWSGWLILSAVQDGVVKSSPACCDAGTAAAAIGLQPTVVLEPE
jgi:hypothetical protein